MYPPITPLEPRRHFAAGSVDSTFGDAGKLLAEFDPPLIPAGISVLPDGRALVAARPSESSRDGFRLLRLTKSGAIDSTFSPDAIDFGVSSAVSAMAATWDGKFVLAGSAGSGDARKTAVARFNADGSLDTTFADRGKLLINVPNRSGGAGIVVIDEFHRTLIGADNAIVRLTIDGRLDKSFSGDGIATFDSALSSNFVQSIFVDNVNRIWAAPQTSGRSAQTLLVRLTESGQLDSSFSGDGKTYISGGNPTDPQIARLPDGTALLANIGGFGDAVTLRRITADGAVDTTFGGTGVTRIVIPGERPSSPKFAVVPPAFYESGKAAQIAIGGFVTNSSTNDNDAFVVRLNADGSVDKRFGQAGVANIDLAGNDSADAIGIGPDGRIIVASLSFKESRGDFDYRFAAARIDGTDVAPAATITRTGTLLVQGSERDELIVLRDTDDVVSVSIDGFVSSFANSAVKRIAVRAGGGRDEVHCLAEVGASIELSGENGNDRIFGNNRDNILRGGDGDDALFGGGGDDTIEGNAGNDTIEGGRGDDRLLAGGGEDELFGNAGRDTLIGDIAEDVLNGGADNQ